MDPALGMKSHSTHWTFNGEVAFVGSATWTGNSDRADSASGWTGDDAQRMKTSSCNGIEIR